MVPRVGFAVSRDENISDRDLNYGPSDPPGTLPRVTCLRVLDKNS